MTGGRFWTLVYVFQYDRSPVRADIQPAPMRLPAQYELPVYEALFCDSPGRPTILDSLSVIRYLAPMTNYHPPIYYKVRTVFRWVFWVALYFFALIFMGRVLNTQGEPKCNVALNFDFTWSSSQPVNLAECSHPSNVRLYSNYTWEWVE